VLQSVAVCCRVIQCAAVRCRLLWGPVCCSVLQCERCNGRMTCEHLWTVASAGVLQYIAVCCSTLLCVAVCHSCGVLQCAAVCCSVLQCVAMCCNGPNNMHIVVDNDECRFFAVSRVCCSVPQLQGGAECCGVWQCGACGAVWCSVLQRVAEFCNGCMTCARLWTVMISCVMQCVAVCCSVM